MDGISYREFARRHDLSVEAIRKAIMTGRIPKEAVGETTLRTGRKRPCIIDPDLASRHMARMTDPTKQTLKKPPANAHVPATGPSAKANAYGDNIPSTADSQAVTAAYKARMAKLEYEKEIGKLINAEAAGNAFSEQIVEARTKLAAVGRMAKERIPHLSIDDVLVIDELIANALEEMSVGR